MPNSKFLPYLEAVFAVVGGASSIATKVALATYFHQKPSSSRNHICIPRRERTDCIFSAYVLSLGSARHSHDYWRSLDNERRYDLFNVKI
jgi:hypothetical protein